MRIKFAIVSSAVAVWIMIPVAAQAFEQTPLAPAPEAPVTMPAQPQPNLSLDGKTSKTVPEKKGRELKLPGIGKLSIPRLNFGLDLMYGTAETDDTGLSFSADPATDDDLTIMGTFKRRF